MFLKFFMLKYAIELKHIKRRWLGALSGGSDQVKNMIYINGNRRGHCFITSGITFKEFASNIPSPLHQVLLLKHNFEWTDFHYHTLFEYVEEENIHKLIQAEIDEFDEFCWVDFDDASDLDELEPKKLQSFYIWLTKRTTCKNVLSVIEK